MQRHSTPSTFKSTSGTVQPTPSSGSSQTPRTPRKDKRKVWTGSAATSQSSEPLRASSAPGSTWGEHMRPPSRKRKKRLSRRRRGGGDYQGLGHGSSRSASAATNPSLATGTDPGDVSVDNSQEHVGSSARRHEPVFTLDIRTQNTRLVSARQRQEIYALNKEQGGWSCRRRHESWCGGHIYVTR